MRFIGNASKTLRCIYKSPHFTAKCAEDYNLSFTIPHNSPHVPTQRFRVLQEFVNPRIFPQKAPDVFCSKTHPLMHWSFAGSESTELSRLLQPDIPLQHPQSSHCCPVLYTDKSSFVSLSCFLNPEACVILVTLRFTWISSFLATCGRYALVMLGRSVGVSSVPSR